MVRVFLCVVALAVAVYGDADPCSPHPDCQSCVDDSAHTCGWCSTNVVYRDGLTGAHCASNDGSHPFACYGVFSTDDCLPGYICNNNTHTCEQTAPGSGTTYNECIAECGPAPPGPSPPAPMYICNTTLNSCVQNAAGTSLNVCQQMCGHAPAVPSQPTPPSNVYLCNKTSLTCVNVPPGTPDSTSKAVCMSNCQEQYACDYQTYTCAQAPNGTSSKEQCEAACIQLYKCDDTVGQCIVSPYPNPGVPLKDCQKNCKPTNNTPSDLAGLWRGLMVQTDFTNGEFDIKFENGTFTLAGPSGEGFTGDVIFVGAADRRVFSVKVTKSTVDGLNVKDVMNATYAFDGATPENRFVMVGFGAPNKSPPADWDAAMTNKAGMTFVMMVCQPQTHCAFNFRSNVALFTQKLAAGAKMHLLEVADEVSTIDDQCMGYSTCAACIPNAGCGWCSVNVVYHDGTIGKNCAGWMKNGTRNQFSCNGVYRTDDCTDYQCVMPQAVCAQVPLGGGMSHEQCEATCSVAPLPPMQPAPAPAASYTCNKGNNTCYETPTGTSLGVCLEYCKPPAPAPPAIPMPYAPTYECNTTSLQCYRVQPGHGTSLELCQELCHGTPAPPSPGPSPFSGTWRGLETDNKYPVGEVTLAFDGDKFTFSLNGKSYKTGTITTGTDMGDLLFKFDDGSESGAIYVITNGFELDKITFVMAGNATAPGPGQWDTPYILGGDNGAEYVFLRNQKA